MIDNNNSSCLFSKKEMYLMACKENGRLREWELIPPKARKKAICENMHLMKGMHFTVTNGFPIMEAYTSTTDFMAIPFTERNKHDGKGQALHFFLDDYRFRNAVWCNLEYTTYTISKYDIVFTPDLSLWRDLPTDFYNKEDVFRTRFIGAYWQRCGFNVIPTASWGGLNSFAYCFEGLPSHSIIAVSGMGNKKNANFSSVGPSQDGRVKPDIMSLGSPAAVVSGRGKINNDMGTSFAAPIIAGMVASLWQSAPNKTAHEVMDAIRRSGDTADVPNNVFGYGIPDFEKAYQLLH